MSIETLKNLDDSTVCGMQKLIRYNIDSYEGFRDAADEVKDADVALMFRELGAERRELADELKKHVEYTGEESEDDGSMLAAVHRTWIKVRSLINGGDACAILCEAEKGEDQIKAAYEDVLKETAGSAVNDILTKQYAMVKVGHDRVRDLRDIYKAK